VERSQVQLRSPFLANEVVKALYQAPDGARSSVEIVLKVLSRMPDLISVPTDTGRLGRRAAPLALLRQTYRRTLVKAEYMTSHGAPNWMASLSAHTPFLETMFLGRDKFQHFRHWMRHELSGFVREVLLRDKTNDMSSFLDMRRVSAMVHDHIDGRANYTDELDKLMTVSMIPRAFASNGGSTPAWCARSLREMTLEPVRSLGVSASR
jgi:asparagine synthase (glutamine-hydrolysing)